MLAKQFLAEDPGTLDHVGDAYPFVTGGDCLLEGNASTGSDLLLIDIDLIRRRSEDSGIHCEDPNSTSLNASLKKEGLLSLRIKSGNQ
jgi:hypothetical protein